MSINISRLIVYLVIWALLFLFMRPKKRKWRIWLYLLLFLSAPCLYLHEWVYTFQESFPDPSGLGDRYSIVNYTLGPFFGIKVLDLLSIRPWSTFGSYEVYHHLFPFNPRFEYSEAFIPCLFYMAFLLAMTFLMFMARKYNRSDKPPLPLRAKAIWFISLSAVLLMSLYAQLFMDKLRWPYFTVELLNLCVLTYLILQLRMLPRRYALAAFLSIVVLFPLSSPSSSCLCVSQMRRPYSIYNKEEVRIHFPSIDPMPIALYQLGKTAFPGQCACDRNPRRITEWHDNQFGVETFSRTEQSTVTTMIFSLLLFGAVLIKSGVVPPLLNSEDTGEGNNMTTEEMTNEADG